MSERPGPVKHVLGTLWLGLTRVRIALSNLIFLALVIIIVLAFRGNTPEPLPNRAALLLNPVGSVVDQKSYTEPLAALFGEPAPQEREVLLADMVDAILLAAEDPRITALVMELDQLFGIGTSKTGEVAEAIAEFRETGKPVIAWADGLSQSQYLLAAEADTVVIHPMGSVLLEGFANYQWYYADALEKVSVNVHVFKAGEFKAIAEPYLRNDMSEGSREISRRWLNTAWTHYADTIEERRDLDAGAIDNYVNQFAERAANTAGDLAQVALQGGLVDKVLYRKDANEYIAAVVGGMDDEGYYKAVEFENYVARQRMALSPLGGKPQVATIVGRGTILGGEQPSGSIGAQTLGGLIADATDDPEIAAIVLRLDTGGGGTFASEIIRRKVLEARAAGKLVVVSMGSVAASGGYWIASAADEIWATPTTITGSIGVFGALPTFEGLLERGGIHTDGVGTTDVAGAFRGDRPLQPAVGTTFQATVDYYYEMFVGHIAEGRALPRDDVYALANGGVFLGNHARELGLVDHIGGGREAVEAAARLAGLGDDFDSILYEEAPSPRELFLRQLAGNNAGVLAAYDRSWQQLLESWAAPLKASLQILDSLSDPNGVYAHCLVCIAP